ncbi:amino acid adenylation domain-containing protein [Amycolatopsis sp. GA6-003]|uniref:amino acid adenylation domain-containing protein n=1 Tax=Amycolatopsis sp. GA6-003 TaxID=2652444 RepID=UPI0039175440
MTAAQDDATGGPVAGRHQLLTALLAEGGATVYPVSSGQRRLWFEDQLRPGRTEYTVVWPLRLSGAVDVAALTAAIQAVVARHEVLRTRFADVDGEPVQVVEPAGPVPVRVVDSPDAEVRERIAWWGEWSFDLSAGPLFVAELLRTGDAEFVLVLCAHHIVFDGWSWSVLLGDLAESYKDLLSGGSGVLPELPLQFGDYAVWERELLAGPALDDQISYWSKRLSGAPEVADLPVDFVGGVGGRSGVGGRCGVVLPAELGVGLGGLCGEVGATVFMGLLGAVAVVVGRYGGVDDVVVGTFSANRGEPDLEGLVGFFVNTVPLRVGLGGDPSFRELLVRCRESALGAFGHQDVPFDRVVEELGPRRRAGVTPFVQVALVLQSVPVRQTRLGEADVESLPARVRTATFELSLHLQPEPDGSFTGFVEYAADVFSPETASRFASHIENLLRAAVAEPDLPLSCHGLLAGAEYQDVLRYARAQDPPENRACLPEMFSLQAARTPDAIAIRAEDETLTYAELDRRTDALAHRLRAEGVGPECLVGVCVERSALSVAALLAVLKAGGAYLPLDPENPADRLAFLISDSGAPLVLVHPELRARLPSGDFTVIELDGAAPALGPLPPSGITPDNLAYVIYTSGSTGRPKGVAVGHRAAITRVHAPRFARLTEQDVMLHALSLSFDVSVLEVFGALTNGCELAVLSGKAMPERVAEFLRTRRVTVAWLTAALFHAVVEHAPSSLSGLRTLIAGGDQLSASHVQRALRELSSDAVLVNGYGPTETTIFASAYPMRPECEVDGRVPIGLPIPSTELYVLDGCFLPVPDGVPGELCIGDDCLARGYLGRPDLTAERFVPSPFGKGRRLYRSGDVVRRRSGGVLEFLGRNDHQVKVRGFRVELGEVEQALRRHPDVSDAVVVSVPDDQAEHRLVGYVEPLRGRLPGTASLREHCRRMLPEYLLPSALVVLDSLPLNANGKVDRSALPEARGVRPETETGCVPARNAIEEALAEVWREALGLDRVGVYDNFFDIGGHSLLASRMLARVRRITEREVELADFFASPTIASMGAALQAVLGAPAEGLARRPLHAIERPDPLPASLGQRRLWFSHRADPDSTDYTVVWPLRLSGAVDPDLLRRAIQAVVVRHEALRTRFEEVDGEPVQIIVPAGYPELPVLDLRATVAPERVSRVRERIAWWGEWSFDLSAGPLFVAELLRTGDAEFVLVLCAHHIVFDGWSSSVLLDDLAESYEDLLAGGSGILPKLAVQFGDYAVWEREFLSGEVLESQLAYWRTQLAGAPEAISLPVDFVGGVGGRSGVGGRCGVVLPAELGVGLGGLCGEVGATVFMGLLGAVAVVVGRYGGVDDVVVGTFSANRGEPDLEGLVGFFVNTVPLRVGLGGDPSFRELLVRCRESALGAFGHQDVPFDRVVEELGPRRRAGVTPFVQVALVLQSVPVGRVRLGEAEVEPLPSETRTATFDLSLNLWPDPDGSLAGFVEYAADEFTPATAQRFAQHVRRFLGQAVFFPDIPISAHDILTPVEHQQLVVQGPHTRFPEESLDARFRFQAAKTPDAVAFTSGSGTLTYAQLDRRSDALARRLRARGVRAETPVGVWMDRGLALPVAVLAIWRVGGAYLPLDIRHPGDRLAWLVADAGARLVLTESGASPIPDVPAMAVDPVASKSVPMGPPLPETDIDGLAAIIYTSGSTGRPKGVAISGRSLLNRIDWMTAEWPFEPGEVCCQKTAIAFVDGLWELLGGLLNGIPTVAVPDAAAADPPRLISLLAEHGVTRMTLVPSLLRVLLQIPDLDARLPSLTRWVSSGEELPADLVRSFTSRMPGRLLRNLYGASEAWDSLWQREDSEPMPGRPVPVGGPISNVRVEVLDGELRRTPIGVIGELYLGGACLARGYVDRPDLTAERFVPDPHGPPGARLYRSFDRARRLGDGQLELHGRADQQLKIRGARVEPAEVERALTDIDGVARAVVTGWLRPGTAETDLVAYVVGEPGRKPDGQSLRIQLAEALPTHLIPVACTVLEQFPLTVSGKVDRRALPEPIFPGEDGYAPANDCEERVRGLMAEVLGIEEVGVHANFFDIGGHSLLAMRLAGRIAETFGTSLDVHTVFEHPTVRALAARLESVPVDPERRER